MISVRRLKKMVLLLLLCGWWGQALALAKPDIYIGVLSHRGDDKTLMAWNPTADYLSKLLPKYTFHIKPLDFDVVNFAVDNGEVDFILVNPGIYVNLEVRYRVSRLATMRNLRGGEPYNIFGGVIFTRSDRKDIQTLEDLRGKSFMAVDSTSLGGFQMAWRELKAAGIHPYEDFSSLQFGGIHDRVVNAVKDKLVDVGTVRTDILERMSAQRMLDLDEFRIINPKNEAEFPFAHSTRLYPEWPFSKVQHTPNDLAQQVAIALLKMAQDDEAAIAGNYAGWTVPLDYQPVHDLFKELHLPPYEALGKFTLWDAVRRYWYGVFGGILVLLMMAAITSAVMRRNRRLARAKRNLEKQHELILNSVADGIYGVDMHGNSTFVNRAMEEITGWSADEVIGKNQHEILHHTKSDGSHHPAHECPVYATYRDNQARFIDDDIFWKKDGSSFSVEYSSTPIKDDFGETMGSVVVFRDTTARKRAEEDRREHQLQLAHVARLSMLGEMASGIAHELNQPLTAISANAKACVHMLDSEAPVIDQCADVMEKIAGQAERAGEVIRQIRHFVQKGQPEIHPVSVQKMMHTVVELIRQDTRRENIELIVELDDSVELVQAQGIQIEQVILNLSRNAIEAMRAVSPERRKLTLKTLRKLPDKLEILVMDTGPGLSADIEDRLFDPFVSTKDEGMGLGLSISKGIVEAHHSELKVEAAKGIGATFRFYLPLALTDTHH